MKSTPDPCFRSSTTIERLDHFIARANAHYYTHHNPFEDFVTAPEISQIFGELLGAWCCVMWRNLGMPDNIMLVEAGPGRGTLMSDALRLINRVAPAFSEAINVHLVETSPTLREVQAQSVKAQLRHPPVWHERLDDLPAGAFILLANEFLDALPIRQFVRHDEGWLEHYVSGENFVSRPPDDMPISGCFKRDVPPGGILEFCEPAAAIARWLGHRLATNAGAALFIDYGYDSLAWGDSLQAIYGGEFSWPLSNPGEADLTAHVDFATLREIVSDAGGYAQNSVTQGDFLRRLGLFQRVEQLTRNLDPRAAHLVRDAAQRLAAPDRMGRLFRVAGFSSHENIPLPGFSEEEGA